jgi:tetratricopeptide (TPR) repeat protein
MKVLIYFRLLLVVCVLCTPLARADSLATLPAALTDRLQAVPAVSLDHLDSDSQEQLNTARARVAGLIDSGSPDDALADAWGELGALYHVQYVNRLAQLCFDNALTLAPNRFRWRYYAAYHAHKLGQLDKAVTHYQAALELRPDYLAINARLAEVWLDLNETDRAGAAYREVVAAKGLEAAAHYGLGQIALLERRHADAIQHFETALEFQPDANRIHYSLAQALRASGKRELAKKQLALRGDRLPVIRDPQIESLQALRQGAHIHFIHGMRFQRKQDFTAARDAFALGLERDPDNLNARISHARTLYLTGDSAGADAALADVLEKDPSRSLAWYLRGVLAEAGGDADTAARHYATALKHDPEHVGALFGLAGNRYRHGQFEEAVRHYATCARVAPENPAVWLPYAGALLQAGQDRAKILGIIEQARQRFAEDPLLQLVQIQMLACSNSPACDARQALERARAQHAAQPVPPHRELLSLALAASGDFATAATQQEELVAEAMLAMPVVVGRLDAVLADYRKQQLPAPEQLFTWQLLQAPPVDGTGVFRDYPTARPY